MSASFDVRPARANRASAEAPATDFSDGPLLEQAQPHRDARATAAEAAEAIARTRGWLLDRQNDDGCWCAELEGDTILESETILMLAFLGREQTTIARRAAAYLVAKQLPGGGWTKFPGGGLDISASVKAYFALKLTGHDPAADFMVRAREAIRAHGGADAVNSFTRFYLALFRANLLRALPGRPAGTGAAAEVVPCESLRHERVVADDRGAAFHRGRAGAGAAD